jgi:hypothetical protein
MIGSLLLDQLSLPTVVVQEGGADALTHTHTHTRCFELSRGTLSVKVCTTYRPYSHLKSCAGRRYSMIGLSHKHNGQGTFWSACQRLWRPF